MFCNLIRNNNNFVEKATELLSNKINQASENAAFIPESLQGLAVNNFLTNIIDVIHK